MPSGKRLLWLLCAPLLVLAALATAVGALWVWLGTDTSLASTLARAAAYLPAGHTLEASDVTGSVRQGGHIGSLAYRSSSLQVEAQDIAVDWQLDRILQRELRLGRLHIAQLSIAQTPSTEPLALPTEFVLPLQVDLPFEIADLRWQGPPALQMTQLAGHYRYDGTQHQLTVSSVQVASGQYAGQATLLARSPLTLQTTVQGNVDTTLPGNTRPTTITATASASGALAGQDALLDIQAQLTPATPKALQATLAAQIHPWAAQPVHQADATFQQLNLADLWPDAPHTLLSGSAHVRPDPLATGTAWRAEATIDNRLSGPWDKNRVPLDRAKTRLQYQQGAWVIESLSAQLGKGDVQLQGHWTGAGATDWTAEAKLLRINPAALHTRMAPALLDGRVTASSTAAAIRFDAALQPSAKAPTIQALQGLRIQTAQATGRWAAGTLSLSALKLQTDDALLQGQLDLTLATRAAKGQLHLSLPGAQADVQGQISASQGAGNFALRVPNAGQATRWLARLPGVAANLPGNILGQAELTGRWTGGWANALAPGKAGTPPFQLSAQLAVPALEIRPATGNPVRLSKLQLDASGSLAALDIALQGALSIGTQRASLNTRATGGLGTANQWQARISSLALEMQDSTRPGPWTLQLDQTLALKGTHTSVDAAAGSASVKGPVPGSVRIAWQPVAWSHDGSRTLLRTQGTLQGLPMGWLETLAITVDGNGQLAQLGLKGDLLLDGDWNVQAAQTLQISANLYQKSGDLQLLTGDDSANGTPSTISAGIRTARIGLRTDGDKLSASLRWDSERAGQAEAELSTQVRQADGTWLWPADAPLNGTVRASLPRVGIWSVLAPPGWRLRGTLAANATLGGTRLAPLWTGTLQADDLALRSVVEGIELRDGRLRASLDGQRLNITEFSLRGAPTAANTTTAIPSNDGGSLNATGNVRWNNTAPAGIQMDIQAQAKTLRISARADRRLTVSGNLQATLAQGKLALQGALRADQALFILPDETAPTLGSDVVVRKRTTTTAQPTAAPVAASNTPEVNITLDLGDDFHLVGRGLDTRLTGKLVLRAGPTLAGPRVTGELRTARGSYKAYGQALDIEEGILRFYGPYDNPSLDVLAIRPNLSVRVGVQINGTALLPNIRLYSDSDLSDAEKLAWLVLGRSAANGGAEGAVLQQAALALLGGNGKGLSGGLASALGLDELSFSGSASNSDGTTSAAAVTFGKRLSRNFYVAYEHSLAGTLGTLYIFYDLSKRFTLRGQTGEQSAIDLIFTLQYD